MPVKFPAGIDQWEPPPVNTWWNPMTGSLGTNALTLNTMYVYPVEIPAMILQSVAMEVSTVGTAGAVLRAGFYGRAPNGLPNLGNLLADIGTQDATTTGSKTWPTTLTWPGGILWYAVCAQGAGCTIRILTNGHNIPIPFATTSETPGANGPRMGFAVTGITGALPTSGTLAVNNNPPPKIFIRRSAT